MDDRLPRVDRAVILAAGGLVLGVGLLVLLDTAQARRMAKTTADLHHLTGELLKALEAAAAARADFPTPEAEFKSFRTPANNGYRPEPVPPTVSYGGPSAPAGFVYGPTSVPEPAEDPNSSPADTAPLPYPFGVEVDQPAEAEHGPASES